MRRGLIVVVVSMLALVGCGGGSGRTDANEAAPGAPPASSSPPGTVRATPASVGEVVEQLVAAQGWGADECLANATAMIRLTAGADAKLPAAQEEVYERAWKEKCYDVAVARYGSEEALFDRAIADAQRLEKPVDGVKSYDEELASPTSERIVGEWHHTSKQKFTCVAGGPCAASVPAASELVVAADGSAKIEGAGVSCTAHVAVDGDRLTANGFVCKDPSNAPKADAAHTVWMGLPGCLVFDASSNDRAIFEKKGFSCNPAAVAAEVSRHPTTTVPRFETVASAIDG